MLVLSAPLTAQAVELRELGASDAALQDRFGTALALDANGANGGNRALIGAELDNHSGRTDAGSAYVFERDAAGAWTQVAKLIASDAASGDRLGTSVALAGELALLGADGDDDRGDIAGAAYVFERDPGGVWRERAKLHARDGAALDIFGDALALAGTRALIGAPGHHDVTGAAYVFERQGSGAWVQVDELAALDGAPGSAFGNVVALAGELALVSAFSDDGGGSNAGAVYVFEHRPAQPRVRHAGLGLGLARDSEWQPTAKLLPLDPRAGAAFGSAVALSGKYALIGAFGDAERGTDAGAAYVFERVAADVWVQRAKLLAPDAAASDFLGASVALDGDLALLSAVGDDDRGSGSGSAHLFARALDGSWTWSAKLLAGDGTAQDAFGSALAVRGELALLGAPDGNGPLAQSGTVYAFSVRDPGPSGRPITPRPTTPQTK